MARAQVQQPDLLPVCVTSHFMPTNGQSPSPSYDCSSVPTGTQKKAKESQIRESDIPRSQGTQPESNLIGHTCPHTLICIPLVTHYYTHCLSFYWSLNIDFSYINSLTLCIFQFCMQLMMAETPCNQLFIDTATSLLTINSPTMCSTIMLIDLCGSTQISNAMYV